MRVASSLLICLLIGGAGGALAQSSGGLAATADILCNMESGAAARACNQYCGTMACNRADDGDSATEPSASAGDCKQARARFKNLTGRDVPCEEMVACPCADPARWADLRGGLAWQGFAVGGADLSDTTCTDDSTETRLEEDVPDFATSFASVDAVDNECRVSSFDRKEGIYTLRISAEEAKICRRLLRRAAGSLCRQ